MKSKITVIGAGSVGATIAYTLSNEDIATEIVLIDINKQKAEGEVMDIIQEMCIRDRCTAVRLPAEPHRRQGHDPQPEKPVPEVEYCAD